ncbi:MAG: hypothetical protein O2992_05460 [Gemmatimonadetes bacterium]|nr:hypothetical protein [Gemmatimonadota bacterium]
MKPSGWYEEDDFLGPVRPARLSRRALFDAKDDDDWDDDDWEEDDDLDDDDDDDDVHARV